MASDIKVVSRGALASEQETARLSQRWVQKALQLGLVLAVLLMLSGLTLHMISGQVQVRAIPLFEMNRFSLADQLLAFGVLILALTPVVRVLTLALLWSKQKDWKFAAVAAVVLAVLTVSILLGGHHG